MIEASHEESANERRNFDLKEQIRAYWSKRSETFDLSVGHKIRTVRELQTWCRLLDERAPGLASSRVLELAFGTGEFTRALLALDCDVDGVDLSEAMLIRASTKHAGRKARFYLGDAERTMMPDEAYDAVVARHLVWTLLEPEQAFKDWLRVLKPGGKLIIADGDWSNPGPVGRVAQFVLKLWDRVVPPTPLHDAAGHSEIARGLYFKDGLTPQRVTGMLADAGFVDIGSYPLTGIVAAQMSEATWRERVSLFRSYGRTFLIVATRGA